MKLLTHSTNIYTIADFWLPQKCVEIIERSEALGYEPATINTDKGTRLVTHVRNNNRVIYKNFELADNIWQQLKALAPTQYGNSVATGLNELFRFYKYEPGQQFKKHRDESYIRNNQEASYFTFMIYLNDNYEGGETTFNNIAIRPKAGTALIFEHTLEHTGTEVIRGIKYVLRSDIMYKLKS